MDYDMSFRADHEADKEFDDILTPVTNTGKVHQLIGDFLNDTLLCDGDDCQELADKLMDLLKPYIKENND